MKWRGGRRSTNIDDRRDELVPAAGMGAPPLRALGLRGSVGALVLLVVLAYLGIINPEELLQSTGATVPREPPRSSTGGASFDGDADAPDAQTSAREDEMRDFVSVILGDTEDTWHDLFQQSGREYEEPILVLFSRAVDSACGFAHAAVGPFYCPADQKLYIDLSFYDDLRSRFHAPGDFAQAYVIAHEVGHHVQNLLGFSQRIAEAQRDATEEEANRLSVRLELQADCLAGVWAHHAQRARGILEAGDVDEGLRAASAIGDDRLQMRSRGYVTPESFTHGTSEQRVHWFRRGLDHGEIDQCNTLDPAQPLG